MKLHSALHNEKIHFPTIAVTNGYGCTGFPVGIKAQILSVNKTSGTYKISWPELLVQEELSTSGGISMDLDILTKKELYNICRNVRRFVIKLNPLERETCGMCAIASATLFLQLKKLGFESEICGNDNHVFLEFDNWTIDVTADQFGNFPKIIITKEKLNSSNWIIDFRITSLENLKYIQKHWLDQHKVHNYLAQIQKYVDK